MNGAQVLIETALKCGIEICFANPGTTEMALVEAMDGIRGMRAVLGLQENVCTGAADGYARIKDRPAMTLLHLGVGLTNGYANLHNARKAKTPIFNVIGEHASWHRPFDAAPLTTNIAAIAQTVSGWLGTIESTAEIESQTIAAINAARAGQIATLIVPHDHQWRESSLPQALKLDFHWQKLDESLIEGLAGALGDDRKTLLVLGGRALREQGIRAAAKIQAGTGCDLAVETFPTYLVRGVGLPSIARIPYLPDQAHNFFRQYSRIIVAGAKEPFVTFFGHAEHESLLITKEQELITIPETQDLALALNRLADLLPGKSNDNQPRVSPLVEPVSDALSAETIALTLATLQPEDAIIVDESVTISPIYYQQSHAARPHSYMTITGAAIGFGLPCAIGAALAAPEQTVINLQADGSAAYTMQALWTQAREGLNIKTLICANHRYEILRQELFRAGKTNLGQNVEALTNLAPPTIEWHRLANSFGIPAARVETRSALASQIIHALAEPGPYLIEIVF